MNGCTATDALTLRPSVTGLDLSWPQDLRVEFLDLLATDGRVLRSAGVAPDGGAYSLATQGIPSGCYIVRLRGANTQLAERFVLTGQ